ncbi:MAG: four helix bundle protein [Planctomycetota bacterium]
MARAPHESSKCWQKAMSLTVWVYRLSGRLPAEEKSGLCAALRRSATGVAQQIADADGRADVNDAIKHYESALAGLRELLTSALISQRLKYLRGSHLRALRSRVAKVEALIDADLERCLDERDGEVGEPLPFRRAA